MYREDPEAGYHKAHMTTTPTPGSIPGGMTTPMKYPTPMNYNEKMDKFKDVDNPDRDPSDYKGSTTQNAMINNKELDEMEKRFKEQEK